MWILTYVKQNRPGLLYIWATVSHVWELRSLRHLLIPVLARCDFLFPFHKFSFLWCREKYESSSAGYRSRKHRNHSRNQKFMAHRYLENCVLPQPILCRWSKISGPKNLFMHQMKSHSLLIAGATTTVMLWFIESRLHGLCQHSPSIHLPDTYVDC